MFTLEFFYSHVVPFINSGFAAWAMSRNLRAARRGMPRDAPMSMAIAGLASIYIFSYASLWLGIVDDRKHWSEIMASISVGAWLVWGKPANARVRNYEELVAAVKQTAVIDDDDQTVLREGDHD